MRIRILQNIERKYLKTAAIFLLAVFLNALSVEYWHFHTEKPCCSEEKCSIEAENNDFHPTIDKENPDYNAIDCQLCKFISHAEKNHFKTEFSAFCSSFIIFHIQIKSIPFAHIFSIFHPSRAPPHIFK